MKLKNFFLVSLIALGALLGAAACTTTAPVYAEGAEKEKAAAAAAPLAQDIIDGIQRNDYSLFSKDFDATMAKAMTQDSFDTLVKKFAAYGEFSSSELVNVQIVSTYYRVNYKLTYADKVLVMGVVIPNDGTAAVSGLWFN
jgi:ABC-type multidrug transport system fused ATPase/permease subunit